MSCDWCDKDNPVIEKKESNPDLYLCDECSDRWGRMEYYSSRTE